MDIMSSFFYYNKFFKIRTFELIKDDYMKYNFFYLWIILFLLISCKVKDMSIVQNYDEYQKSKDWMGEYLGIIPCADCEGIETHIKLNEDYTYEKNYRYLGKSDKKFYHKDNFKWSEEGLNVELVDHTGNIQSYAVQKDKLIMLNQNAETIEGDLAEKYELHKIIETEEKWVLVEMYQKPLPSFEEEIYITIDKELNKISGFAGCNQFFGNYEIQKKKQVEISGIGMTKKYCEGLANEIEKAFMESLNNTAYHVEEEDELRWVNAEGNEITAYFRKQ